MAKYQIQKLKNRDLNHALEIQLLESENENLKWRIRSLQIQLQESQEKIAETDMLLREKDETLAEYLAQINEMDNDLNSGQGYGKNTACPLCFKDLSTEISEKSTRWVEIQPCGHRQCWKCFITTAEKLEKELENNKERQKKFTWYPIGYEAVYRYICGICNEPIKNWNSQVRFYDFKLQKQ